MLGRIVGFKQIQRRRSIELDEHMTRLSPQTLPETIPTFDYDRNAVTVGIAHFGIGNFHRAHQAVYCDDLLATGDMRWGITGISLRSASMQQDLEPQDYLYTLATLSETTQYQIIGAIKSVLVAPSDPQAVIDLIAKHSTQVVSSTVTEKGYYLASGEVDFAHANLQAEVKSLDNPVTLYGFIAAGIIKRFEQADVASPLTVMCCDNISAGGEKLKDGVLYLLSQHSAKALAWAKTHVSFISSMVDRVCPATDDALKASVLRDTGREDLRPVSAEPFRQWVIEDNFAGERPAFDSVGAVFVDDISPFEDMKLGYLNAAHTMISSIGHLSGDRFVHESLMRPEVLEFTQRALHENVLPNAAVPTGYDGKAYIQDVIKRFQNGNLPYANLQVGTDSSQKIQQRWFPTIEQAVTRGADTSFFEFCLGAWVVFVQSALATNELNDPMKTELSQATSDDLSDTVASYLKIANVEKFEFSKNSNFITSVQTHASNIKSVGIASALQEVLGA